MHHGARCDAQGHLRDALRHRAAGEGERRDAAKPLLEHLRVLLREEARLHLLPHGMRGRRHGEALHALLRPKGAAALHHGRVHGRPRRRARRHAKGRRRAEVAGAAGAATGHRRDRGITEGLDGQVRLGALHGAGGQRCHSVAHVAPAAIAAHGAVAAERGHAAHGGGRRRVPRRRAGGAAGAFDAAVVVVASVIEGAAAAALPGDGALDAVVLVELGDGLVGILLVASTLVQPGQDAVRDGGGPQAERNHLLEEPQAGGHVIRLDAAIHESVVDQLVAAQAASLDRLDHLQGLVQVAHVAIAFQQGRESDEVRLVGAARGHHLPKQALGGRQVVALDASIQDGVVGDSVVWHTLGGHLAEQLQGIWQVLVQAVALDESRVQDRVLVLA
mmetsp:Transcript_140567/g.449316  ORF Transcript_140567/g.449316 Transcript_140567/m.449316 type:complete len:389 (-) Transcript_140567:810-1976(-)